MRHKVTTLLSGEFGKSDRHLQLATDPTVDPQHEFNVGIKAWTSRRLL